MFPGLMERLMAVVPCPVRAHACSGVSVVMAMLVYTVRFVTVVRVVVVRFPQLMSSFFLFVF